MTVLLVDIGNTRIKWARLDGQRIGRQHAAVHSGWRAQDYARVIGAARGLQRILAASVASSRVNRNLAIAARCARKPLAVASHQQWNMRPFVSGIYGGEPNG